MRSIAIVVGLFVLFPVYAFAAQLRVATWNIQYLSELGEKKRQPEDYERLRQIAESLKADVIALQEVDDAFVGKVFDPDTYHLELSGRDSALKTGLAIRRGIQYARKADVTALDVGDLRYGTHIELHVGPHRIDVLSIHLQSGCFSHTEDASSTAENAPQRLKTACRQLTAQVPILKDWIDRRLRDGRALLVLGDFNRRLTVENDWVWRELAAGEPATIRLATAHTKPRCWDGYYQEFIDHILVGPKTARWLSSFQEIVFSEAATKEGRTVWEERISDHCPLRATFNIEEEPALGEYPNSAFGDEDGRHSAMEETLGSFIGGLKEWQTLVAGVFALIAAGIAAIIAWKQLNHQREESERLQRRRVRACKAILPVDLDSFIDYLHECYKITATIRMNLSAGGHDAVNWDELKTPRLPDRIMTNMQVLIEYLDEHNASILSEVLGVYQVQHTRFSGGSDNPRDLWDGEGAFNDLVFLYLLIGNIYPFARGQKEKIALDFSEGAVQSALVVLDLELSTNQRIYRHNEEVKNAVFDYVVAAAQCHFRGYDIITT